MASGSLWWFCCCWFTGSCKGERTCEFYNAPSFSHTLAIATEIIMSNKCLMLNVFSLNAAEVWGEGLHCSGRRCHAIPVQCLINMITLPSKWSYSLCLITCKPVWILLLANIPHHRWFFHINFLQKSQRRNTSL